MLQNRTRPPRRAAALLLALAWAWLAAPGAPPAAAAEGGEAASEAPDGAAQARTVVEHLHDALLEAMHGGDEMGYAGRRELLQPVLRDTYDLHYMARKSLGRHWRKLSEAEQQHFLEIFRRLSVANYAGRFSNGSGHRFETRGVEDGIYDTLLVRTRLEQPDDEPVQLDYRLHQTDAGWRIIDVYLNGTISELALRRSEYSAIMKREGFDELVNALEEKIGELQEGEG